MKKVNRMTAWAVLFSAGMGWMTLSAQSSSSTPEGYFTANIAAGSGTSPVISTISFPLQGVAMASGQMVGIITGVTANTITNGNGGWTAGQLSQAATPYLIQITSGSAAGRTFLISTSTANTQTTVTLDAVDAASTNLTTLGITTGTDTYQIIPADTLSSIFGTPATTGIQGGATAAAADQVQLFTTMGWLNYYYNTSSGWLRVGPPIPSGNVVIRPDTAVIYSRLGASPLTLTLMGRVPTVARQALVSNNGVTYLSNSWPTSITLVGSNIQNTPNWISSTSSASADTVQIFTATGWLSYYYNGTHWYRVGPPIMSDAVTIPAGSAVIIGKKGSAGGASVLSEAVPYNL